MMEPDFFFTMAIHEFSIHNHQTTCKQEQIYFLCPPIKSYISKDKKKKGLSETFSQTTCLIKNILIYV